MQNLNNSQGVNPVGKGSPNQSPETPTVVPKKTGKKSLWIIITIIVIAAVAAGAFFWWQNMQKNDSPEKLEESRVITEEKAESASSEEEEVRNIIVNEKYHYSVEYPEGVRIYSQNENFEDVAPEEASELQFSNFRLVVSNHGVPKTAKAFAESDYDYKLKEVLEEKETLLDGVEAYYVSSFKKTESTTIEGQGEMAGVEQVSIRHDYSDIIFAVKDGYSYKLMYSDIYSGENPEIDRESAKEKFDTIVSSFKFLDVETVSLDTGCLDFPAEVGNTWKYKDFSDFGGLTAENISVSEVTSVSENGFVLLNNTIEGDAEGSWFEEHYGFDSQKNMYLNYRNIKVGSAEREGHLAGGEAYYYNNKIFSCVDDAWPVEAKASPAEMSVDEVGVSARVQEMSGEVKILDRNASVSVPAGDFTAVLVQANVSASADTSLGEIDVDTQQKLWFAPGVGLVKKEESGVVNSTTELLEYEVE